MSPRVAAALLLTTMFLVVGCAPSADSFSADPSAPLQYGASGSAVTSDNWSTMTAYWNADRPEVTFAVDVCVSDAVELASVTLVSFTPYEIVGDVAELPTLLISAPDDGDAFISVNGYPPVLSTGVEQSAAEGALFTHRCGEGKPFQQIAVGLGGISEVGGGWRGATLRYEANGREYSLNLPISFLLCGTSTEPCDGDY